MAYFSTVTLGNFLGDIQAKASTLVTGGEERIKNLLCSFCIYTGAVINDIDEWLIRFFAFTTLPAAEFPVSYG